MSNMVVATNVLALNSHRNLKGVGQKQSTASSRLSSGYRINSAADDAAGLAISEKMRAQIRGLDQASTNAQDAISLIQTAEGGMQEIDNMVQRIRELVVQASNDTNDFDTEDRQKIQDEIQQLLAEIDSMSERVEFNQKAVIDGSYEGTLVNPNSAAATAYAAAQTRVSNAETAIIAAQTALDGAAAALTASQGALTGAINTALTTGTKPLSDGAGGFDSALQTALSDILTGIAGQAANINAGGANNITQAQFDEAMDAYYAVESAFQSVISAAESIEGVTDIANVTAALTALGSSATTGAMGNLATALGSLTGYTGSGTHLTTLYGFNATANALNAAITGTGGIISAATTVTVDESAVRASENVLESRKADLQTAMAGLRTASKAMAQEEREGGLYFQIGANSDQGIYVQIATVNTEAMGIGNGAEKDSGDPTVVNVLQPSGDAITGLLDVLDDALSYVTTQRSKLGAVQNRLEYTINSLDISSENLSAAESRIRDTDMAKEMMNLTQANVLQQAATSMLAQANSAPQSILQLLS